ncbi:EpsG family protein [Aminivibrio sp.]|jgi:hypothetical protein|uniref:EpsG family protein n=1 Tax=Aminivibrio sp. TaxID=1872489 RepID=UPI003D96C853
MIIYFFLLLLLLTCLFLPFLKNSFFSPKAVLLLFMWILFWGNRYSADYEGYSRYYDLFSTLGNYSFLETHLEPGFVLMNSMGGILGLTYNQFLFFFSLIGFSLLSFSIEKASPKPELVYAFYFLYPFLIDVAQIRFFFAVSLFVYSLKWLSLNSKKSGIKYVFCILLAASFHITAFPFVFFIFFRRTSLKKLFIYCLAFTAIIIFLLNQRYLFIIFSDSFLISRLNAYIETRTRFGHFLFWSMQGMSTFFVFFVRQILKKNSASNEFLNIIYRLNIFCLLFTPFYMLNGNFFRYYRFIAIPNYIVFSWGLKTIKLKNRAFLLFLLILVPLACATLQIYIGNIDNLVIPIIQKNLLWH